MERRIALVRLTSKLRARLAAQHKKLATELTSLRDRHASQAIGDSADGAFENLSDELTSQLAQVDARELDQIAKALARHDQGKYGVCEGDSPNCQKLISLARLTALPESTLCIHCQRQQDRAPNGRNDWGNASWGRLVDIREPVQDRQIVLSDLVQALPNRWRR